MYQFAEKFLIKILYNDDTITIKEKNYKKRSYKVIFIDVYFD